MASPFGADLSTGSGCFSAAFAPACCFLRCSFLLFSIDRAVATEIDRLLLQPLFSALALLVPDLGSPGIPEDQVKLEDLDGVNRGVDHPTARAFVLLGNRAPLIQHVKDVVGDHQGVKLGTLAEPHIALIGARLQPFHDPEMNAPARTRVDAPMNIFTRLPSLR